MSLKFGLNLKKKLPGSAKPAPAKRKLGFGEQKDDTDESKLGDGAEEITTFDFDATKSSSVEPTKPKDAPKDKAKLSGPPTLKSKAKFGDPSSYGNKISLHQADEYASGAMDVDPSIYDYDAAYDAMHATKAAKAAVDEQDALLRRPKYMDNLMDSADLRKKDQLRARDKLLKREREAEGDEFDDKEKFVTGAYKEQQEEVRRMEEEEKKKQEAEEAKRRKGGMQGFYRQVMEQEEERHREAMEAAAQAGKGVQKPVIDEPKEKTAAELARDLNEKGKNIVINEEGQVADKRQLLTAGLNVVAKPKSATASAAVSNRPAPQPYRGRNAVQQGVRDRQTKLVEEQLMQATKRAADQEAEEQRKLEHASKSRKTEEDKSSARERYLARKKAAAEAAKG